MARQDATILVVDDSSEILEVLEHTLTAQGYGVLAASSVEAAVEVLGAEAVDLVITDLKMPRRSGLDLVRYVRENISDAEVMMITGYATVEGAVEAVKTGAEEYLPKPFTADELLSAVRRVLDKLRRRRLLCPRRPRREVPACGIMGNSPAIARVLEASARAAASDATVLVTGESGVGKELVARAIHAQGRRAQAPFIPINSGAIPAELFESELFGHARGAFTGATEARTGLFQAASGGTVFLDEISEMPANLQVKLLRVLQDGEVWRVGAARPRRVDVRFVAATNQDLGALVKAGRFRQDLLYRIRVITVDVPPLRERGDDVLELADHFAVKFAAEASRPAPTFTDAAVRALQAYRWPGNVRELENLVQSLVVMTDFATIDVSDLPALMRFTVARADAPTRSLAQMELEYIQRVLASVGGNKTRAAKILGIDRKTLREKLKSER